MFHVYVIWNAKHGRYYIGQTADLERRLQQHNNPLYTTIRYTKKFDGEWMPTYP